MRQKIILILTTASAVMLASCDNDNAQTVTRGPSSYESNEEASSATPSNGSKVALVIGNGAYTDANWPKLRNAPNDAEAIAAALRRLGFIVTLKTNLVKKAMRIAISDFGTLATNAKVALFFYAGHGIQDNNQNYLIPVDGTGLDLADAIEGSVSFELLLRRLMHAKSQVNIVMLDACRTNTGFSRGQPGLANVSGSSGTVIFYATQPGNIAADRVGGGDHSPFTNGLLTALDGQDLSLGEVLKFTSQQVKEKTGGQQIPYVNGPRDLDDFLLDGELINVPLVESVTPMQPVSDPRADEIAAQVRVEEARLAELKRQRQAEEERLAEIRKQQQRKSYEPEMVAIPAGSFEMGSPKNEQGRYDDEGPVHTVHVKAFQMGKYEVTQGEWQAVMGNNPSYFSSCGEHCPVENVSWNDVQEYIAKLNAKTGKTYRLPTEAEWEYAARAGTSTRFSFGNDDSDLGTYAWFIGNSDNKTHPVGKKQPNPWGLYDMHGNVWEWNQDKWHSSYAGAPTDGSAWEAGDSNSHLLRGCSWGNGPDDCRSADRANVDRSGHNRGVRVVAAVSSP